jgi:tight adherence protein C
MVLIAALVCALGVALVVTGIATQHRTVSSVSADALDHALTEPVTAAAGAPRASLGTRALEPLITAGSTFARRLSPVARVGLISRRITLAGLDATTTVQQVLGYKAFGGLVGLVAGLAVPLNLTLWLTAPVLAVVGFFVPDVVLDSKARARQEQIGRDLSESLDLIALSVEAGLGLEQAVQLVVDTSSGPLAGELKRFLGEIDLGVPRRDALGALRERTDVLELSGFVVALMQADALGISIGEVLRGQAAQVRLKRTQRARERAAKTPVKILFPLVIGIFPAIFVVTIGPGAINILHTVIQRH